MTSSPRNIRVLLIAPSLRILGGQAVQATRLLAALRTESSLTIDFQPINPRLPGFLQRLQTLKFVRTIVNSMTYIVMLLARVWRYDIIHIFSAGYSSYTLWTLPALFIARLYGKR